MNDLLNSTRPHPSKQISDVVARDPDIVNLTVGEPAYAPPRIFLSTVASLAKGSEGGWSACNRYAHSRGVPNLRQAIADYYRRIYGLVVDPESQILVTHGAAEAIWLTIFTLTNPGDEVIIFDPCYMLYEPIIRSMGRCVVPVPTDLTRDRFPSLEAIKRVFSGRTRLLLLNSPSNPTGMIYDLDALSRLTSWARESGIHVMHDEVFDRITFGGGHVPVMHFDPQARCSVMVNSFSKRFGMTGWRLGWLVASPEVVAQASKAHTLVSLSTGTMIQEAAAAALNDPEAELEMSANVSELQDHCDYLRENLLALGGFTFPSGPPMGGFYLFAQVSELYSRLPKSDRKPDHISEGVARFLLERCKVAVVPGTGFGTGGEGFIRISFAAPREQLAAAVGKLSEGLR